MTKVKFEDRTYINLDVLREEGDEEAIRIADLIRARDEMSKIIKETEDRKKAADVEIKAFIQGLSADGAVATFVVGKDGNGEDIILGLLAEERGGKSSGKWNKEKAVQTLKPAQLDAIFTEGKAYTYVVTDSNGRAERVLAMMED